MSNEKLSMILSRGISCSGKTTWAEQFVKENPNFRNINRDDIRLYLFGREKMYKGDENEVTRVQTALVENALQSERSIIISDTNLNSRNYKHLLDIAEKFNAEVSWKDFTDIDLQTCLERDRKREFPVGDVVIKRQFHKYMRNKINSRPSYLKPQDTTLPKCSIWDYDGTLTTGCGNRSPYDMSKVSQDEPNPYTLNLLDILAADKEMQIFIFSGREEKARTDSLEWLRKNTKNLKQASLESRFNFIMREDGDNRRDSIIKEEFYQAYVKGKFHVMAVVDDRKQVCVETWAKLGLPLFRIGDPEADF